MRFADTEPQGEFCEEGIATGGGNETSASGVEWVYLRAAFGVGEEGGVLTEDAFPLHPTTDDKLVAAPSVVAATSVAGERATKV